MKPSFALDFRDGMIALLHRTARGWHEVGATPADAPDLAEALGYLRSTALGLSPRGLATKLVIPNEQILYTQVHAPGPEAAKRRRQIKAALEGLTPYKVDDLVYDWWGSGPEVHVAVVARETLAEAEAFAAEHRFNPVSFVASPEDGAYRNEPFFGPSALAATLLAEGEKVERDQDPIAVIVREFPRHEPAAEPVAEPEVPAAPDDAGSAPAMAEPDLPAPDLAEPDRPEPDRPEPDRPEPDRPDPEPHAALTSAADGVAVAHPEAPMAEDIPPVPTPAPAEAAATGPQSQDSDVLPDFSAARAPAAGMPAFDPGKMAVELVDEAPMALDVTDDPTEPPDLDPAGHPSDRPATADSDLPPAPAAAIVAAFASRRSAEQAADPGTPAPDATPADFAAAAEAKARKSPAVGPAPAQRPSVPRPALAKPAAGLAGARGDAVPFPARSPAAKLATGMPRGRVGVTSPGIAGPKRDRNVVPLPKSALPPAAQPAETPGATGLKPASKGLTGLDGRPLPVRGKPRYLGLFLTGLLLLALAAVAFWSSFYLTSNDTDPGAAPAQNAIASVESPEAAAADDPLPSPEDEALADGQDADMAEGAVTAVDPAVETVAEPVEDPVTDTVAAGPTPDPAEDPGTGLAAALPADPALETATEPAAAPTELAALEPEAAPQSAAEAEAAPESEPVATPEPVAAPEPEPAPLPAPETGVVTEAAVAASPDTDPQDEIFLAAADTPPQTSDPVVMPPMASLSDPPPELAAPPPPFGTVYTFDAEGRIQPTPEGIITPEGVLLIAGAPPVVPPTRPAALAAAPVTPGAGPEAVLPAAEPAPVGADPALADKKPRPRPETLTAPDATAGQQGEALAPAPDSRLANARPQKRPEAVTSTASAEAAGSEIAAGSGTEAAAASLAANGVQASVLAVASSRRPAARPSGRDQAVEAAVAAAIQAQEPQAQAEPQAQTASLAPEEQEEPEAEAPAPNLPTSASVAKQATVKDALNLSRVALIGIFGTSNGRYAMVRQSGGGIRKVVVGDQIDGGRVAAISATALQYQKGSRMVTLSLPKG